MGCGEQMSDKRSDAAEQIIRKVELILINEGQHDPRFEWGEWIRYTPAEVAEILRKHADELLT